MIPVNMLAGSDGEPKDVVTLGCNSSSGCHHLLYFLDVLFVG